MPDIGNGLFDKWTLDAGAEHRRRMEIPITLTLTGGVIFVVVVNNQASFNTLQEVARDMVDNGDFSSTMPVKDSSGVTHNLTAPQVLDLYQQHSDWFMAHWQAYWALIDMDDLNIDYTDDQYWPPNFVPSLGLAGTARWPSVIAGMTIGGVELSVDQKIALGHLPRKRRIRL
jgi:hypothetical protein